MTFLTETTNLFRRVLTPPDIPRIPPRLSLEKILDVSSIFPYNECTCREKAVREMDNPIWTPGGILLLDGTVYDRTDEVSVRRRSVDILGHTIDEVLLPGFDVENVSGGKGNQGGLIEQGVFATSGDSESLPDLREIGREIKTTTARVGKQQGRIYPREREVHGKIDYQELAESSWEDNHFRDKSGKLLRVVTEFVPEIPVLQRRIVASGFMGLTDHDEHVLSLDFDILQTLIRRGEAHRISSRSTKKLDACTKSRFGGDTCGQPFSRIPAAQRALSLKARFLFDEVYPHLIWDGDFRLRNLAKNPWLESVTHTKSHLEAGLFLLAS